MVVGKILGMAGKKLAKKFLSKKLGKKGTSTFLKRREKTAGLANVVQRVPGIKKPWRKD